MFHSIAHGVITRETIVDKAGMIPALTELTFLVLQTAIGLTT